MFTSQFTMYVQPPYGLGSRALRFCGIYPVNHMETQDGVPGVLYGRYEKDRYGHMSQGNPWVTWLYSDGPSYRPRYL